MWHYVFNTVTHLDFIALVILLSFANKCITRICRISCRSIPLSPYFLALLFPHFIIMIIGNAHKYNLIQNNTN